MRRWPTSSAEALVAHAGVVLLPVGVVLGLASERAVYEWDALTGWIPDLIVGLVFIGCGVQAMSRDRGTALLLAISGYSWFLANFWADASFLHRGLLVHLLVTFPGWRPRSRLDSVVVTLGYLAAVVVPIWNNAPVSIVLAVALVGVGALGLGQTSHRLRRLRRSAFLAMLAFACAIIAAALAHLVVGEFREVRAVTLLYDAALAGVALWLSAGLSARSTSSVMDLVVELGETRSGTLRDALASTLGDPTLEVGYWDGEANYFDVEGRLVTAPDVGASRLATRVEVGSQPLAVIVHDGAILGQPALIEAVAAATRLSTVHAELQTAVRLQLKDLSASRRRLVSAADEERERLDSRLRHGAEKQLRELEDVLRSETSREGATPVRVTRALSQLAQTIKELRELGGGLHPGELDRGLLPALEALAARSPVPVDLAVLGEVTDPSTRTAIYYVCAEALANTVKHAEASFAAIETIVIAGRVTLCVTDDGSGGADTSQGSGLRGLIDRIEALGGSLHIESPRGGGTRLVVDLPNSCVMSSTGANEP